MSDVVVDHNEHGKGPSDEATIADFKATPGPAVPDSMPEAASKDELKAKAAELNQK